MRRCDWAMKDPMYIKYHDLEWGVPVHDDRKLFEMLLLEGAQAGLSWLAILKRRETYRILYDDFDPMKIARWEIEKVESLLQNPGIIRNRLKVEGAIANAKAYLNVLDEFKSFDEYLWSFVGGITLQNAWLELSVVPASTKESIMMSKDLKHRGFKFVGPTICYAFMQAVGMVNDHLVDCFRYDQVKKYSEGNSIIL